MSQRTNAEYLKNEQYYDARNLNARIELHRRFSTNPENWFRWVFDRLELSGPANILELGCGPGMLWKHNHDRISPVHQIYLSDFSPGMLYEAHRNNIVTHVPFCYTALDAQAIPFPSAYFDLVIANHMLYHVPNRPLAFAEIRRVLKPGGKLVAATNGINHMGEIRHLLIHLDPGLAEQTDHAFGVSEFTIENSASQLIPWFDQIEIVPFNDSLEVTDAEPLLAYILSMTTASQINATQKQISAISQLIKHKIAENGSIHISKSTALFLATKSRSPQDDHSGSTS
jgi:ubiquinone/menaquinone biosynthesis C-methylase UbiE